MGRPPRAGRTCAGATSCEHDDSHPREGWISRRCTDAGRCFGAALAADGSGGATRLFASGANLCKLVETAKLNQAIGLTFQAPVWRRGYCRWEIRGGRVTKSVLLTVRRHEELRARPDRFLRITTVKLPGTTYAAVASAGYRGAIRDSVVADYPQGTVLITLTVARLTVAKAVAVAQALIS
jgi:hypothetical protein